MALTYNKLHVDPEVPAEELVTALGKVALSAPASNEELKPTDNDSEEDFADEDDTDDTDIAPRQPPENASGPTIGLEDFDEIFTRFQTPLTNFIFRLVGNHEQALDLTQDAFVRMYRALANGTKIQAAALSSWAYRIASNLAVDALRRRRLIAWLPLSLFNEDRGIGAGDIGNEADYDWEYWDTEPAKAGLAPTDPYNGARFEEHLATAEAIQKALDSMSTSERLMLILAYKGFSHDEIARLLDIEYHAMSMRFSRARSKFIRLYCAETGLEVKELVSKRKPFGNFSNESLTGPSLVTPTTTPQTSEATLYPLEPMSKPRQQKIDRSLLSREMFYVLFGHWPDEDELEQGYTGKLKIQ